VEGETGAQGEGVDEPVFGDGPLFGEVGDDPEFLVELDETREEVRQQFPGNDPEVDLGGIEGRDLTEPEPPAKRAALHRILAQRQCVRSCGHGSDAGKLRRVGNGPAGDGDVQ
jgi:hypothetical protein